MAFAPFESADAGGRAQGFQIDLLQALQPLLGARISVRLQPWARTEADFRAGRLDLIAMVDTEARREWARFAHGHATPALALYRRRDRADFQDLAELAELRVAVLDGEPMRDTAAKWLGGLRLPLLRLATAPAALSAVAAGEVDVALLPRAYADAALAAHPRAGELAASELNLRLQSYAFAVAPDNEALRGRLQAALAELERRGTLEALRLKWLSSHRGLAERGELRRDVKLQSEWTWGIGAGASLALFGAGWLLRRRGQRIALERQRRRAAEAQLLQAEALLGRAFTHNAMPMLVIEQGSGLVRDVNEALCALLGVAADALLGQPLRDLAQHLDTQTLEALARSLAADGVLAAVPLRLQRGDGQPRDCLVSAERMRVGEAEQVFCILQDVTEQLARDAALKREYDVLVEQLAGAREELQQFTRAVSHDLKAPLRAVQGFSGLLRDRLRAGHVKEAMDCSEHIDRAAMRMSAMLQALSRLAQLGSHALVRGEVHMHQLAGSTWAMLAAGEPGRQVGWQLQPLPPAQADAGLVAQVWQNLLDNAWKYTARSAQPKVKVDAHLDGGRTWYRVTDNGAGFNMAQAERLFLPFQRMHAGAQFAGSGIGLSLVRRIVELHGGQVRLRSSPNVGTVCEFTLQAAAD